MADQTLLREEIQSEATNNALLVPFDPSRVKGASYDLAAGRTIIIVHPDNGGITPIDLEVKRSWEIPPGRAAILYTLEKVRMPLDMKGRLSMRSRLATRLLLFAGGPIDPGYRGHLFLPLANLSDVPIKVEFGQPIATAEFIRLERETQPYSDEQYDSIPPDRLPAAPPQAVYDLTTLTNSVRSLESALSELRNVVQPLVGRIDSTSRIVDWVVLAALGGVGAGGVAGGIIALFTQLPYAWNIVIGPLAALAGLAVVIWATLRGPRPH